MKRYLAPLGIFAMGQLAMLLVFLLFPALGNAGSTLASETAGVANTFWGWTWVVTSIKLIVFLMFEAAILWVTGRALFAQKSN